MISKNWALHTINFGHMLLFDALVILVPLYLLEKGFNLESIGLILAVLPVIMFIARTIFSLIGDTLGTRSIFLADGISMTLAVFTYIIAQSPLTFAIGKTFEGIGNSAYWAVIRTETYHKAVHKEDQVGRYMSSIRSLGGIYWKNSCRRHCTVFRIHQWVYCIFCVWTSIGNCSTLYQKW